MLKITKAIFRFLLRKSEQEMAGRVHEYMKDGSLSPAETEIINRDAETVRKLREKLEQES